MPEASDTASERSGVTAERSGQAATRMNMSRFHPLAHRGK
jgi:hypothetical protein